MNTRQRATLAAIFEHPTRSDVRWSDVKSMLEATGARVENKRGSRRLVVIGEMRGVFHDPHPRGEMRKYAVEGMRRLLKEAGITPGE